jgi:hypothetical protein
MIVRTTSSASGAKGRSLIDRLPYVRYQIRLLMPNVSVKLPALKSIIRNGFPMRRSAVTTTIRPTIAGSGYGSIKTIAMYVTVEKLVSPLMSRGKSINSRRRLRSTSTLAVTMMSRSRVG